MRRCSHYPSLTARTSHESILDRSSAHLGWCGRPRLRYRIFRILLPIIGGLAGYLIAAALFRPRSVGKQFGKLPEAAGMDTVVELAQRNPVNLFNRLTQVNVEKKLVGGSPLQAEVNTWVEQTKGLPRVVEC